MSRMDRTVGAYAVQERDRQPFLDCGFQLAMTSDVPDPAPDGMVVLDAGLLKIWRDVVLKNHRGAKKTGDPIVFTVGELNEITRLSRERIHQTRDRVAGYYIQDDYVGNVQALHEHLIGMVRRLAPDAEVVIGLGCTLDLYKGAGSHPEPNFTSRQHYTNRELLNWTPKADWALTYIYSLKDHAPDSDFSMQYLLPWMMDRLEEAGFDPNRHKLMGGPQCWHRIAPTPAQVAQQCGAFVELGHAEAICAFTWGQWGDPNLNELRHSADLRAGLQDGMRDCQRIWSAG